jgi:hypothetical protein
VTCCLTALCRCLPVSTCRTAGLDAEMDTYRDRNRQREAYLEVAGAEEQSRLMVDHVANRGHLVGEASKGRGRRGRRALASGACEIWREA